MYTELLNIQPVLACHATLDWNISDSLSYQCPPAGSVWKSWEKTLASMSPAKQRWTITHSHSL